MPLANLKTTPLDHMPEDFTLEGLSENLTEQEIDALNSGDDPLLAAAMSEDDVAALAAAQEAAAAPAIQIPAKAPLPDTTAAAAIVAKMDDQLNSLSDQYDNGEISKAELLAQQRTIIAEQARAQVQLDEAQRVMNTNVQIDQKAWWDSIDAAKAANPVLWSDTHLDRWDATLKTVNATQEYSHLSFPERIALAANLYAVDYTAMNRGKTLPPFKGGKAPAQEEDPALTLRTDERDPPMTLAGFNGDTTSAITDGTFAAIDRIADPIEAEKAFNRLTSDQQAAYLNQ